VALHSALSGGELGGQFEREFGRATQTYKRADDKDAHPPARGLFKPTRHQGAVLCEGERDVLDVLAALQDHRL